MKYWIALLLGLAWGVAAVLLCLVGMGYKFRKYEIHYDYQDVFTTKTVYLLEKNVYQDLPHGATGYAEYRHNDGEPFLAPIFWVNKKRYED